MLRLPLSTSSFLRAFALVLIATVLWAAHYGFWQLSSLRYPTDYSGDSLEVLARMKAASEGDLLPVSSQVVERLGAPFGAYWNAYPTPDKPLMLAIGGLVHLIGLFPAANLGLWIAQISAVLSFYWVARRLRCRWEWAFVGALLFAFSYHSFSRGLPHFSFVFTWTIPLGLLAVWIIADSKNHALDRGGLWICLGAAAALGCHNPYFLYFWLQLMALAVVYQFLGARRRQNILAGIASIVVAVLCFFVMHSENWLFVNEPDGLPLLARNYGGTERYALKAVEMFIPPADHAWSWFSFFGHRYNRWSEWRGEAYLPYLGIVGATALIWLMWESMRNLAQRRPLPGQFFSFSWILAYSSVGGVTNLLALFAGFHLFRATNRVVIFISAILLLFLAIRLTRLCRFWPRWLCATCAGVVGIVGLWDQLPQSRSAEARQGLRAAVDSDADLAAKIEGELPDGGMVFQMPVLDFPEVVPPAGLSDYEHFRLYLHTEKLEFSYGTAKHRSRGRWQRELEALPASELVKRLESFGFSALYINRKGFEDRADRLLSRLNELGYQRKIVGMQGNQNLVLLKPSQTPVLPLARSFTFGRGWYPPFEPGIRWAYEDAALSFFNPYPHEMQVDVRFSLQSVDQRKVRLCTGSQTLAEWVLEAQPLQVNLKCVKLRPGVNRLILSSDASASSTGPGRYRLRSFGVSSCFIRPSS